MLMLSQDIVVLLRLAISGAKEEGASWRNNDTLVYDVVPCTLYLLPQHLLHYATFYLLPSTFYLLPSTSDLLPPTSYLTTFYIIRPYAFYL